MILNPPSREGGFVEDVLLGVILQNPPQGGFYFALWPSVFVSLTITIKNVIIFD
jgi:hypothetical protein